MELKIFPKQLLFMARGYFAVNYGLSFFTSVLWVFTFLESSFGYDSKHNKENNSES